MISTLHSVHACSMYKVTSEGKTMVGCNEDAWRTSSSIWFENAQNDKNYGACFTGSRRVGANQIAPQSGMNVEGLVFSRLVAYHPILNGGQAGKRQVDNEVDFLKDILHTCKTVQDVKAYVSHFDRSIFIDDVFIYIDKSGDYLVVEPYQVIEGNDSYYVLANFCPSVTSDQTARKQERYNDGSDFLKIHGVATSLDFCRSMSDTMHVCRSRNGDGTLLSSIWDTKEGLVNLYFYHNYDETIQFDIRKELAQGDRQIRIPDLFSEREEFTRLKEYKTPFNVNSLRVGLVLIGGAFLLLSLIYVFSYVKNRTVSSFNWINLLYSALNIMLLVYLFILATNRGVYYFDAPYKHPSSNLISMSSYMPFLLLILFVPLVIYAVRYIKCNRKEFWVRSGLMFNSCTYLVLIIGFYYWGLYDVIN